MPRSPSRYEDALELSAGDSVSAARVQLQPGSAGETGRVPLRHASGSDTGASTSNGTAHTAPETASTALSHEQLLEYVQPLQESGQLVGSFLSSVSQWMLQEKFFSGSMVDAARSAVAQLLRWGVFTAASRFLAAEEHRGTSALLGPAALPAALMPATRMCWLASTVSINIQKAIEGNGPQQQRQCWQLQMACAVLQALDRSRFLERICRATMQRPEAGSVLPHGGPGEFRRASLFEAFGAADSVTVVASFARGPEGAAPDSMFAKAVECGVNVVTPAAVQYFLASCVVSCLSALDGGPLYGMPYSHLTPLQHEYGNIGQHMGVHTFSRAFSLWAQTVELRHRADTLRLPPALPALSARSQVALCLRAARLLLDMMTHGSHGGGSGAGGERPSVASAAGPVAREHPPRRQGSIGSGRAGGGAVGAGESPVPKLQCADEAVGALGHALRLMKCTAWGDRNLRQGSCGVGDGGGGGGVGAGSGGAAGASSALNGRDGEELPKEGRLFSWLRRGTLSRSWWALVVAAVHAQLDAVGEVGAAGAGARAAGAAGQVPNVDGMLRKVEGLLLLPGPEKPMEGVLPGPEPWLTAALSAGYIPCLERLLRACMAGGGGGGGLPTRVQRVARLQCARVALPLFPVLVPLLQFGEERQAASLLVTLLKESEEVVAALQVPEGREGALEPELAADCAGMVAPFLVALIGLPDYLVAIAPSLHHAPAASSEGGAVWGAPAAPSGDGVGVGGGGPTAAPYGFADTSRLPPSPAAAGPAHAHTLQLLPLTSLALPRALRLCQQLSAKGSPLHPVRAGAVAARLHSGLAEPAASMVCRVLRLAIFARRHAAARGDAHAEGSWSAFIERAEEGWPGVGVVSGEGGAPGVGVGGAGVEGVEACERGEDALASLLLAPCYAGRVLAVCSNPRCGSFEGGSEAGRPLKRCGGRCGGAVAYCCAGCQRAHWAAGHREECGRCD